MNAQGKMAYWKFNFQLLACLKALTQLVWNLIVTGKYALK